MITGVADPPSPATGRTISPWVVSFCDRYYPYSVNWLMIADFGHLFSALSNKTAASHQFRCCSWGSLGSAVAVVGPYLQSLGEKRS